MKRKLIVGFLALCSITTVCPSVYASTEHYTDSLKAEDAVEQILNMFSRTKTNAEFVQMAKKQKFL